MFVVVVFCSHFGSTLTASHIQIFLVWCVKLKSSCEFLNYLFLSFLINAQLEALQCLK